VDGLSPLVGNCHTCPIGLRWGDRRIALLVLSYLERLVTMTDASNRANELQIVLLNVCKTIESLAKDGIKIEFHINTNEQNETRLSLFRAMQEIKLNQ
jgi:hypothetical protein